MPRYTLAVNGAARTVQSGQLMAAAALLARNPHPTDAEIDREMTNICRCGTYQRIRTAVHRAAQEV